MNSKKLYILSDTKRLQPYSNVPYVKLNEKYYIPAFVSKQNISFVKHQSKHPYHIIRIDENTLMSFKPNDVEIKYYDTSIDECHADTPCKVL